MVGVKTYTNEQNLIEKTQTDIRNFWQTGIFHSFDGVDDITIKYAVFINKSHYKSLIIVQGRSESYLKYKELCFEFYQQGFNIFLLDHRGQGLSGRMLANPHKGYVSSFDDYAEDLHTFISVHVLPFCPSNTKPYLLAHSMGCAITSIYLAKYSKMIQAAVFSSPMFAINTGGIPSKMAKLLINGASFIERIFTKKAWYFPGQKNHYFKPFSKNKLTHSPLRYQLFKDLYHHDTELQLGGVTIQWLKLAHQIKTSIFSFTPKISTPLMVLQAGQEAIVDNRAQDEFCQQLHSLYSHSCPNGQATVIEGARHELFFEKDAYRELALAHCLAWFEQHQ
ncbi:MAG: alpha/beta fold hydrolase [Thalassotalea sp.]